MSGRLVALVTSEAPPVEERRVHHFVGSLPDESEEIAVQEDFPWPTVLLIRAGQDAGFLLYRYTQDGQFAGDTWHMTLDEAKDQADFEFGEGLGPWRSVPEEVADPVTFALQEREIH